MLRLRDDQWKLIREHFPEEHIPDSRPGLKPIPTRAVLAAVLWILKTDAQWHFLPQRYPNYKTVHHRFQQWCQREVLTQLANTLREDGMMDERESFIDATFAAAIYGGTNGAGSSKGSLPGSNGNGGFSFVGSITPRTSSVLCSLPVSPCS
jgi:transposase